MIALVNADNVASYCKQKGIFFTNKALLTE